LEKIARELRVLSNDLHPESLRLLGLMQTLRTHGKAVALHRDVAVHVRAGRRAEPKDLATALALFRIAQDSLFNAVVHGAARRVDITVQRKRSVLTMTVADNGGGFDTGSAIHRIGLGLNSIEERARLVNGQASFRSRPGRTVVEVVVPGA
jgi:signal transduction histidine kinase